MPSSFTGSFPRVSPVSPGQVLASSQHNLLAGSINRRILSGLADMPWRSVYAWHSVVRNLRLSSGFLTPAEDEWWWYYGLLSETDSDWPTAGVGDPEGLSTSNPLVAYFYGQGTLDDEKERGDEIPLREFLGAPAPSTPLEVWDLGKLQRGAINTSDLTNFDFAPAMYAARLVDSFNSGIDALEWKHKTAGGKIDTVNRFIREKGQQWNQMREQFLNEWRGTDDERQANKYWDPKKLTIDYGKILTSQYFLAPSYGTATGSGGSPVAQYPLFEWDADAAAGTYGIYTMPGPVEVSQITNHASFVFAGIIVKGISLTAPKSIQVELDGVAVEVVTVDATTDEVDIWWPEAKTGQLKFKLLDAISGPEDVWVEVAELLDHKPELVDVFMLVRAVTIRSSSPSIYRGKIVSDAKDISDAYFINGCIVNGPTAAFVQETKLAKYAPYQAARDFIVDFFRVIYYDRLKGYHVNGDGNSVLTFDRRGNNASNADIFQNLGPRAAAVTLVQQDVLYKVKATGGSPSGTIGYDGESYSENETFRGTEHHDLDFTNATDLGVFEEEFLIDIDDIPPTGHSNEWIFSIGGQTVYKDTSSATYKPDAYGNILGAMHDRCHTFSTAWKGTTGTTSGKELNKYGNHSLGAQAIVQRAETPPAYRYEGDDTPYFNNTGNANPLIVTADGASQADCRDSIYLGGNVNLVGEGDCDGISAHYESCKVFKAPYLIKSIKINASDSNRVDVELRGRLERNESAPATIDDTIGSRASYLSADTGGRSDENTVVALLRWQLESTHDPVRIGDISPNATGPDFDASNVDGAVLCRFFLQKLVPQVHEDGNATVEVHSDTRPIARIWQYIEFVIRASVGGFLNEKKITDTLVYHSTGGGPHGVSSYCDSQDSRDLTMTELLDQIGSTDDKFCLRYSGQNRGGHGPLPSTIMTANQYSEVANALNLLSSARFSIPIYVESRTVTYRDFLSVPLNHAEGFTWATVGWQEPQSAPNPGAWGWDSVPFGASADAFMDFNLNNGNIEVAMQRTNVEWRARPHPKVLEAVPDALRSFVDSLGIGVPIVYEPDQLEGSHLIKTPEPGDLLGDVGETFEVSSPAEACIIGQSGTLKASAPPSGTIVAVTADITDSSGTGIRPSAKVSMGIESLSEGYVRVPVV